MMVKAILSAGLLAAASAGYVYTGAGGCDVSDAKCIAPPDPLSQQINVFSQKADGAALELIGNYTTGGRPSWVVVDEAERCLFATLSDISRIVSYERMGGGKLELRANVSAGGLSPVYIDEFSSAAGKALLVANYNGDCTEGGTTVASILVGERCALTPGDQLAFHGSGPDPTGRQVCSHAHSVVVDRASARMRGARGAPGGGVDAFVQDLGADKVYTVRLDVADGSLALQHTTAMKAGSGPRHLAVHPVERCAYLVHEMANLLSAHSIGDDGTLTLEETFLTFDNSSGGFSKAAEIAINGNSVFVSNRGFGTPATNTVAGFAMRPACGIAPTNLTATGVSYPRGMELSADGKRLLVAGQGSGNIVSFPVIEGPTESLLGAGATVATDLPTPTTIAFAKF